MSTLHTEAGEQCECIVKTRRGPAFPVKCVGSSDLVSVPITHFCYLCSNYSFLGAGAAIDNTEIHGCGYVPMKFYLHNRHRPDLTHGL